MSTSDKICKDGASKSNDDGLYLCELEKKFDNMSTADKGNIVSVCANCGKEGAKNICNKCTTVKYCNAACKKKHRHKHKKDCEEQVRLAAEHAARLHDEELFKQPPPEFGDCPICFLRIPTLNSGSRYKTCCGKVICSGCIHAPVYDNQGNEVDNQKCAFCRAPTPDSDGEIAERYKLRIEAEDPIAIYNQGIWYRDGMNGFTQDMKKALELWHRAGKLGYAEAYTNIGYAYSMGRGVEVDEEKAEHYYELAAMGGNERARHNLGILEENRGNIDRALKHYLIAVRGGYDGSLEAIKELYLNGHATKDDYTKALQSYQEYLSEIKSVQRDKAAAADEEYLYY